MPHDQAHPSMGGIPESDATLLGGEEDTEKPIKDDTTKDWEVLLDAMKIYDNSLIEGWVGSMNNLLVFAGLFSAVVTAFVVESYSWLQPDPADASNALLSQISLQLTSFSVNSAFLNSSAPAIAVSPVPFQPSALYVRINVLWFLSLALSLVTALFVILVQQWLSEYPVRRATSVRQGVRIRQLRFDALYGWGVVDIITLLPVLLQIALVLFLVGLVILLWSLNAVVAHAVIGLIALPLAFFASTAFLPLVWTSSPYKSTMTTFLFTCWLFISCSVSIAIAVCACIAFCVAMCAALGATAVNALARSNTWTPRTISFVEKCGQLVVQYVHAAAVAFTRLTERGEWINGDSAIIERAQADLDSAAVKWSPRALSLGALPHLDRCFLDLTAKNSGICALSWAGATFNVSFEATNSRVIDGKLRKCLAIARPEQQIVQRLQVALLHSLSARDGNDGNELDIEHEAAMLTFLRFLNRLHSPLVDGHTTRYQNVLLRMHSKIADVDFGSSPPVLDDWVRVVMRSMLDCWANGVAVPADRIDLTDFDRRVLALLSTVTYIVTFDIHDGATAALAVALLLHAHHPASTADMLQPLVTALQDFVRLQRVFIRRYALISFDTFQTGGSQVPAVWPTTVATLRALAERAPPHRLSGDTVVPLIDDLLGVFACEDGAYFQGIATQLQDFRGRFDANNNLIEVANASSKPISVETLAVQGQEGGATAHQRKENRLVSVELPANLQQVSHDVHLDMADVHEESGPAPYTCPPLPATLLQGASELGSASDQSCLTRDFPLPP